MAKSGINIELPKFQIDKLNRDLNKYSKHKNDEISEAVELSLRRTLSDAKSDAGRISSGLLTSGYVRYFKSKLSGLVWFNKRYAPYVEFGTGDRVFKGSSFNFTPDIRKYASQFKKNKRHKGVIARPYLFPAFIKNTEKLTEQIQKLLSKK